jgi:hypothetical protein
MAVRADIEWKTPTLRRGPAAAVTARTTRSRSSVICAYVWPSRPDAAGGLWPWFRTSKAMISKRSSSGPQKGR